MTKQLL